MHIKWERRNPKSGLNGRSFILKAVLVEHHLDNSTIKPRLIEPLGSIEERFLATKVSNMRAFHQGLFWVAVDKKLDHLKLDPQLRTRIESDISETVPRPDEDWALWGVTCIPKFDL